MPSIQQWVQKQHDRDIRKFHRITWQHIRRFKSIKARRKGHCPHCKESIVVGDRIAMPYEKNNAGGNVFSNFWYCYDCAQKFQLQAIAKYWAETE